VIRTFRSWLQDSCRATPTITFWVYLMPGNVTSRLQPRLLQLSSVKFYMTFLIMDILRFTGISIAFWSEIHLQSPPCATYNDNQYLLLRLAHHFPVLSRYQVIKAPSSRIDAKLDFEYTCRHWSHLIVNILNKLCNSDDLADQLHYLRNLDVNTRALLQNTVFENEMLIAYIRIYHTSSCENCMYGVSIRGVETYIPEANVLLHHYLR